MSDQTKTTKEPAGEIIEAVARLQIAFQNAGLREPVALVVAGEEQRRLLEEAFARYLGHVSRPNTERPWETSTSTSRAIVICRRTRSTR